MRYSNLAISRYYGITVSRYHGITVLRYHGITVLRYHDVKKYMCLFFWQGEKPSTQASGGSNLSRVQSMAGRDNFWSNLMPSFRQKEAGEVPPMVT